jgi:hypothetical protein
MLFLPPYSLSCERAPGMVGGNYWAAYKFPNCLKWFEHQDFCGQNWKFLTFIIILGRIKFPNCPKFPNCWFFFSILESISHEFSSMPIFFICPIFLGSLKNLSMWLIQSKVKLTPSNYFIYPFVWTAQGLVIYYLIFLSF